jgi:hypothetical protein
VVNGTTTTTSRSSSAPGTVTTTTPPLTTTTGPPGGGGPVTFNDPSGNSVTARCVGTQVQITDRRSGAGFREHRKALGPAAQAFVTFKDPPVEVTITVWCEAGEPQPSASTRVPH